MKHKYRRELTMNLIRGFFSNDDGTPSGNRFFLFLIITALITWASMIVFKSSVIPEIPSTWVYVIGIFSGVVLGTKVKDGLVEIKTAVAELQNK